MRRCGLLAQVHVLRGAELVWQPAMWMGGARLGGRTLLVSSVQSEAWQPRLSFTLLNSGVQSVPYTVATPLPTAQVVRDGVEMFRRTGATSITVLGNGAIIDAAKGIAHTLNAAAGAAATPLLVIPTTLSPVGCHDAWLSLHPEDDVFVETAGNTGAGAGAGAGAGSAGTTTVVLDPALLEESQAFVSPLVSAVYLAAHLVDSEMARAAAAERGKGKGVAAGAGAEAGANVLPPELTQLGTFLLQPGADQGQQQARRQQVDALAGLAAVTGQVRRSISASASASASFGAAGSSASASASVAGLSALPLELASQLALLHSPRALAAAGPASWHFSWLHVRSLQALLPLCTPAQGADGEAHGEAARAAVLRVCAALGVDFDTFARAVRAASAEVDAKGRAAALQAARSGKPKAAAGKQAADAMSVAGAVEGLIAAQEEMENKAAAAARGAESASAARNIRAPAQPQADASARLELLRSDFFLDLAESALEPPI